MQKIFFNVVLMAMFSILSFGAFAQNSTDTLTVSGNCGQCKTRIEEASYIKGVKHAEWNKQTKVLTVVYNKEKTSKEKIALAIASAGHDSKSFTAPDKAYKSLPSCCAYRTGTCDHD